MSQTKATTIQNHTTTETMPVANNLIITRRTSRPLQSVSPSLATDSQTSGSGQRATRRPSQQRQNQTPQSMEATTESLAVSRMTTRSRSTEARSGDPSAAPTSSSTPATTGVEQEDSKAVTGTKRPHTTSNTMPRKKSHTSSKPVNQGRKRRARTSDSSVSETSDSPPSAAIQEKLDALDKLETAISNGTDPEFCERAHEIKARHDAQIKISKRRFELEQANIEKAHEGAKKAAYDDFYFKKAYIRAQMIREIQHKLKVAEQEHQAWLQTQVQKERRLSQWIPPDRHTSICIEPEGLSESEIESDFHLLRRR